MIRRQEDELALARSLFEREPTHWNLVRLERAEELYVKSATREETHR